MTNSKDMISTTRLTTAEFRASANASRLCDLVSAVNRTNRLLNDMRQRRAAERAAELAAQGHGTQGSGLSGSRLEPDPDCCVCYEPLDRPHAVITACGHVYHRACLENAMEAGRHRCPICRRILDTAELIQVMNGLPVQREFEDVCILNPQKVEPCDLTADKHKGLQNAKTERMNEPDASALLDIEIANTLQSFRLLVEKSSYFKKLEADMRESMAAAKERIEQIESQALRQREEVLSAIKCKERDIRADEKRLQIEREDVAQMRKTLSSQIAEARKRADALEISRKAVEAARVDADEKAIAAVEAKDSTERLRDRFQRLAKEFEQKKAAVRRDTEKVRELQAEVVRLQRQTVSVGNASEALRLNRKDPANYASGERAGISLGRRSRNVSASAVCLDDEACITAELREVETMLGESSGAEDDGGDDDDDDDDVVAEADISFRKAKRPRTASTARRESGVPELGETTQRSLQKFASAFGPFRAVERPPAPRNVLWRPKNGNAPGLSAFGPKAVPGVVHPGPIAGGPAKTSSRTRQVMGVKRAMAPAVTTGRRKLTLGNVRRLLG